MYQFFVDEEQKTKEGKIHIIGPDVNHIKNVIRMKIGNRVRVSVRSGESYFCDLEAISDDLIVAAIVEQDTVGTELSQKVILFQGLPKGDKMELIIQKMTELGVAEIYPVAMKNCVVKLDEKKAGSKVTRWQAIAESAAKQSKRTVIPTIHMPVSYEQAKKIALGLDIKLVPYENARGMEATREIMSSIQEGASIGIFIGPEGGFDQKEIDSLEDSFYRISLGRRILRTETAGLATMSMLVYCLDN